MHRKCIKLDINTHHNVGGHEMLRMHDEKRLFFIDATNGIATVTRIATTFNQEGTVNISKSIERPLATWGYIAMISFF